MEAKYQQGNINKLVDHVLHCQQCTEAAASIIEQQRKRDGFVNVFELVDSMENIHEREDT